MRLHRTRAVAVAGGLLAAAGVALVCYGSVSGAWGFIVVGGVLIAIGGSAVWESLRPYRLIIGPDGLDVRRARIDRLVPWTEIDAIVLTAPSSRSGAGRARYRPLVLVVPDADAATPFELPLEQVSPADDRPAALLLDTWDVRERPDDIAGALAEHAGERFHDLRPGRA